MIFDGKQLAQKILDKLKTETATWTKKPKVAVVSFGKEKENSSYILQKEKTANFLGFGFNHYHYKESDFPKVRDYVNKIVKMENISAVVMQLPLPEGISPALVNVIPVAKDPDLLSDKAVGIFFNERSLVEPPTPAAILHILDEAKIKIKNKKVVVFGFGRLVGRFLVPMLLKRGALVSIVEKDADSASVLELTLSSDIIISATGSPRSITGDMVRANTVIVDAGFSILDGKIVGDVDYDSVKDKVSFITLVPGGVGPVGVAQLFLNVTKLFKRHQYTNASELRE